MGSLCWTLVNACAYSLTPATQTQAADPAVQSDTVKRTTDVYPASLCFNISTVLTGKDLLNEQMNEYYSSLYGNIKSQQNCIENNDTYFK